VFVFEVVVPNFIDKVAEKLGDASLGCLGTSVVIKSEFVGGPNTNVNDCCGIVGNHLVIEWETSRVYEFGTMVSFVLDGMVHAWVGQNITPLT
jgi:hypothetical protein